ncbi:MAG: phosphoribosyltransferase domain-containing protein [Pseudomonadota bacterium]
MIVAADDTAERHVLGAGTLSLRISRQDVDDLFVVAERQNPKRAFVFVSTVLGRHIPVAPAAHRAALVALARKVAPAVCAGPILVMSYAETAIGLGLGVAEELARLAPTAEITYLPTTRFPVPGHPVWFEIEEAHSHAVDHTVLRPDPALGAEACKTLVLVDDETTTGATFRNLGTGLASAGLRPERVVLVTLTDWSGGSAAGALSSVFPGADVRALSLLSGAWGFAPKATAPARALPRPVPAACPAWSPAAGQTWAVPRQGVRVDGAGSPQDRYARLVADGVLPSPGPARMLVIGAGEHAWQPFLAAEAMATTGAEIRFITTTRSPVRPGGAIAHQIAFPDHYGLGLPMYLNNVVPEAWDDIVLMTETGAAGVPAALRAALGKGRVVDGAGHVLPMLDDTP